WHVDSGDGTAWQMDQNGELVCNVTDEKKQQGWLLTDRDYTDFVLRLEFQLSSGANSGVAFRMAPKTEKPLIANIDDDSTPRFAGYPDNARSGALFNIHIDHRAELHPVGEWNTMELTVQGRSVQIKVNDRETTHFSLDDPQVTTYLGHAAPAS